MTRRRETFEVQVVDEGADGFSALSRKPVLAREPDPIAPAAAATARLHSLDLRNQPLISDVPGLPGEVVVARSIVPLSGEQIGSTLVLLFEHGDVRRPIVLGVLHEQTLSPVDHTIQQGCVSVQVDDGRVVLSAEREIVLRCGNASITLTRAGKVLLKGAYVSSRSSGVNRIKGGSVQIN